MGGVAVENISAATLVRHLSYKPGWTFRLGGPHNKFLCVYALTPDSQRADRVRTTQHMFELPDLTGRDLIRWTFERLLLCEQHETGEFFAVDGYRPFMPHHQDEGSPYDLVESWET